MGKIEGKDGIDITLDQTPGARDRIQRGIKNMKVAAVTTLVTASTAAAVDLRAGLVAGAAGAGVTLLSGMDGLTMPYLDGMEFIDANQKPQETPLAEGIQAKIS